MASNSSKALPYVSMAIAFVITIAGVFGYGMQAEQVATLLASLSPILGTTAAGGLINKAIEGSVEKRKALVNSGAVESIAAEVKRQLDEAKKESG